MAFPYDEYERFLTDLMPEGASLTWKGDPEPFYTPIGGTAIICHIDVGDTYGYGTSETRTRWVPEALNGRGANATYVLQRMSWPLTLECESFDASAPGETYLMVLRNKLRWPSAIKRIQDMGLTTIKVGNVRAFSRMEDDRNTFVATLMLSHGQCFTLQAVDDDGNVIEIVEAVGTLTEGRPDPVTVITDVPGTNT